MLKISEPGSQWWRLKSQLREELGKGTSPRFSQIGRVLHWQECGARFYFRPNVSRL